MKRVISAAKKIINRIRKSVARPEKNTFEREERNFFKEAKSKFLINDFKHSAKKGINFVFDFVSKNKMYIITVVLFFAIIGVMGNSLTGRSIVENNLASCDENYKSLSSDTSAKISNLEVDLNKCNGDLTSSKSEFSRVTNSMNNLTDEFVSCYSNMQSLGSLNSECTNNLLDSRNNVIDMEETVKDALEQESNAKDALNTTQQDYAKLVENYAKFKCCILKINDFTVAYYYVNANQVVCTSASNENTSPLTC